MEYVGNVFMHVFLHILERPVLEKELLGSNFETCWSLSFIVISQILFVCDWEQKSFSVQIAKFQEIYFEANLAKYCIS